MVKYMNKKSNIKDDVTELSHSSMGVRTRAKTLALQQHHQRQHRLLSNSPSKVSSPNLDSSSSSSSSYLQLRSRRLVKTATPFRPIRQTRNPNFAPNCAANSGGGDSEGGFGEKNLEFECRKRSTRESTPCNFIRDFDTIGTPGSTTCPASSSATNHRVQGVELPYFPTIEEIEEFFAFAEQHQLRLFSEKYNFDFVNDLPLRGRYDWVSVNP